MPPTIIQVFHSPTMDFEPIPDIRDFTLQVLEEHGFNQGNKTITRVLETALNTSNPQLSLACIIFMGVLMRNGITGVPQDKCQLLLRTLFQDMMDKHPYVKFQVEHIQRGGGSPLTILGE